MLWVHGYMGNLHPSTTDTVVTEKYFCWLSVAVKFTAASFRVQQRSERLSTPAKLCGMLECLGNS